MSLNDHFNAMLETLSTCLRPCARTTGRRHRRFQSWAWQQDGSANTVTVEVTLTTADCMGTTDMDTVDLAYTCDGRCVCASSAARCEAAVDAVDKARAFEDEATV